MADNLGGQYSQLKDQKFNKFTLLISILLIIAPLTRGMYFDYEFYFGAIYLGLVFIGFLVMKRLEHKQVLALDGIGLAGWGVLAAYLLSLTAAVLMDGAVGQTIRWGTYLLAYYVVAYSTKNKRDLDLYLAVIYVTAVIVAVVGLGTAFGTFHFSGAFSKGDGRILSTIQYYNSTAVYLNAALIIGLFLGHKAIGTNGWNKFLAVMYAIGNYLLFITFVGTQSRGAWLIFPLVTAVYLAFLCRKWRLPVLGSLLISIASALAVAGKVLDFSGGHSAGGYWLWLAMGMILCGTLQYGFGLVYSRIQEQRAEIGKGKIRIGAGILALVLIVGIVLVLQKPEVLPTRLVDRVKSINFQQHSVQERFYFYKDALKIIKDHPLIGTGGKGWEGIYRQYQSYLYDSSEVHNHFLQVWVETGVVGFLFFLAVWGAFARELFRARRSASSSEDKCRLGAVGAACIALGLHGIIDFTLSIGAIMLLLWCLFGLVTASERLSSNGTAQGEPQGLSGKAPEWLALALAVIVVIGATSLEISMQHGWLAAAATTNDGAKLTEFEAAHFYDPFKASYLTDLGNLQLSEGLSKQDYAMIKQALETETEAEKLDQGNPKIRQVKAKVYFSMEQMDKGSAEIEQSLRLAPWKGEVYESAASLYFEVGKYYYKEGNRKAAKEYFGKAVGVADTMNKQIAKLTPETKILWDVESPILGETEDMTDIIHTCKEYIKGL